jgi:WD40 repeat protein
MFLLKHPWLGLCVLILVLLFSRQPAQADAAVTKLCPAVGIQPRGAQFQPGGIILTSFDKSAIWVYNIDNGRRYPLPDTAPCGHNCHLSPDASWLTYFNDPTNTFNKMRLDGTQRSLVALNAAEVSWWDANTLLVWTPGKGAYLQQEGSDQRQYLNVHNAISVQPGGHYGVIVEPKDDGFQRALVDLDLRGLEGISDERVNLGVDVAYFNAQSWSPDGHWLAYVAPVDAGKGYIGGEIFGIHPGDTAAIQWTRLIALYGAERINGVSVGELSWSPDGTRIAFWVTEITGPDVTANLGNAVIHILDVTTGTLTVYCGFATNRQTPNPPSLVWSPDGTHLAFGGGLPNDNSGYYLLALDVSSGQITSLSQGIYPVLGSPDVIAWGIRP